MTVSESRSRTARALLAIALIMGIGAELLPWGFVAGTIDSTPVRHLPWVVMRVSEAWRQNDTLLLCCMACVVFSIGMLLSSVWLVGFYSRVPLILWFSRVFSLIMAVTLYVPWAFRNYTLEDTAAGVLVHSVAQLFLLGGLFTIPACLHPHPLVPDAT